MNIFMIDAACNSLPYDHSLCEALVRKGCRVNFFGSMYIHTDWNQPASYNFRNHFYKVTNWIYKGRPRGFLKQYIKAIEHILNMVHLLFIVKKVKPDIIHFQWSQLPFIDRWYLRKLNYFSPVIYTIHNSTPLHGEKPKFYFLQKVGSSFLKYFDYCIVHTNYSKKKTVKTTSLNKDKILVIPHGLLNYNFNESQSYQTVFKKYNISKREKIILFFGNIDHYKGLDILIRSFSMLSASQLKEIHLLIVGRPNIPIKPLINLSKSLYIEKKITWDLRFISENEIQPIFNSCYLIVMPYRHIDQSGVLMSVINYGKPIVASRVGGFNEILDDGVHGKLVNPEDEKDLAFALSNLIEDHNLINEMSESVKRLAQSWPTWDKIAEKTIEAYQFAQEKKGI